MCSQRNKRRACCLEGTARHCEQSLSIWPHQTTTSRAVGSRGTPACNGSLPRQRSTGEPVHGLLGDHGHQGHQGTHARSVRRAGCAGQGAWAEGEGVVRLARSQSPHSVARLEHITVCWSVARQGGPGQGRERRVLAGQGHFGGKRFPWATTGLVSSAVGSAGIGRGTQTNGSPGEQASRYTRNSESDG